MKRWIFWGREVHDDLHDEIYVQFISNVLSALVTAGMIGLYLPCLSHSWYRSTEHQFSQVIFGRFLVVTTVGFANPLCVSQVSFLDVVLSTGFRAQQATALELVVLLAHTALHDSSHDILIS